MSQPGGMRRAGLTVALLVAGVVAGSPALAQQATGPDSEWCNPVNSWGGSPVRTASGGYAIHAGSYPCPPGAAAAVAPGGQTEYMVFFDWDRSEITPAADRIIGDVAAAWGHSGPIRINVIGHTDSSGPADYNQGLSVRRAAAVRAALARHGIPAGAITTEGRGESQLLVQTGPNVREPSNRRAQIVPRPAGPTS